MRVQMQVIRPEEYAELRAERAEHSAGIQRRSETPAEARGDDAPCCDAALVDYLLMMDAKLDRILSLLQKESGSGRNPVSGRAVDISGSGMRIFVNTPVEIGRILHVPLLISKFPLNFIDLYGEVTRIDAVSEVDRTGYHIGVRFLDLDPREQERIINFVFKKNREALRRRRTGD